MKKFVLFLFIFFGVLAGFTQNMRTQYQEDFVRVSWCLDQNGVVSVKDVLSNTLVSFQIANVSFENGCLVNESLVYSSIWYLGVNALNKVCLYFKSDADRKEFVKVFEYYKKKV